MLIRPTSLVLKELFFCILSVPTRLVSLVSIKRKEYFFGHHLCNRSIPTMKHQSLISIKRKEYFFGHHLCNRSIPTTKHLSLISIKRKEHFFGHHLCNRSIPTTKHLSLISIKRKEYFFGHHLPFMQSVYTHNETSVVSVQVTKSE